MSLSPLLLGIDLGTSSVKALVVALDGTVLGRGVADYLIYHPQPDQAEQDPNQWWDATCHAIRQAVAMLPNAHAIVAIGVTGQMHGTVLLDRADALLGPAIIWPDQRSHVQVDEITAGVGAKSLITITGTPVATGFQAATLRWLQQARPDLMAHTGHVLLPKDYLRWRLTREFATDPSDGSGSGLLDVNTRTWATALLDMLEIDPAWLPPVQPATGLAGTLQPSAAAALGLPPGLPVITGAADTPCSALAAGVTMPDTLLLTLSSGGQLLMPSPTVALDLQGRSHTFCNALTPEQGAGWYRMAALLTVGLALRWLRDEVLGLTGAGAYERITAMAASVPMGAQGLLFLPYLAGERSPHMNPQARGAFIGLTLAQGRAQMARAVLEGVSLACYDAFTALEAAPQRIVLAGGGASSPFWRQLLADIFGVPVQPLAVSEQSALGAALLGGAGCGHFDLVAGAQAWARYAAPVMPDPARHAAYQAMLPRFRMAYQQNRELFAALGQL